MTCLLDVNPLSDHVKFRLIGVHAAAVDIVQSPVWRENRRNLYARAPPLGRHEQMRFEFNLVFIQTATTKVIIVVINNKKKRLLNILWQ